MKILYIHQYFITPQEPGGSRSYWISQELIKRGHSVTMITSANKFHNPGRENIDGIDVVYVDNPYDQSMSNLKKIRSFLGYIRKACVKAEKEKNVDIVFATSTPLTIGAIALWLRMTKKWKYVFEVRDLWPEFPIQIGAIKNPLLIKLLKAFEKKIYDKSEHVVALSPGMKEGVISAGQSADKVSMIPNMSKPDQFYPHEANLTIARKFGIDLSRFNIIHFGSMGIANGLEYIIEAAKEAQDRNIEDIRFLFAGSGATESFLQELTRKNKLKNIAFLGNHPMKTISEIVNLCDASITTFKNLPILQTNSPNKLFDSLSAGKPIIVNSAGWTKDLVENENCGLFVDPDNPKDLIDKICQVKDDKSTLKEWGENARKLSIEVYDKNILSAKVADIIENSVK